MKELKEEQLREIHGGGFWAGIIVGYVVGEVINGIYQAQQSNCENKCI